MVGQFKKTYLHGPIKILHFHTRENSKMFHTTSKYFSFFNNKPPASWVVHIPKDFLTGYSCSYYSSMAVYIPSCYTKLQNNITVVLYLHPHPILWKRRLRVFVISFTKKHLAACLAACCIMKHVAACFGACFIMEHPAVCFAVYFSTTFQRDSKELAKIDNSYSTWSKILFWHTARFNTGT